MDIASLIFSPRVARQKILWEIFSASRAVHILILFPPSSGIFTRKIQAIHIFFAHFPKKIDGVDFILKSKHDFIASWRIK